MSAQFRSIPLTTTLKFDAAIDRFELRHSTRFHSKHGSGLLIEMRQVSVEVLRVLNDIHVNTAIALALQSPKQFQEVYPIYRRAA